MKPINHNFNRRDFLMKSGAFAAGCIGLGGVQTSEANDFSAEENLFVIGPIEGYSPHIGTLVSMLNYNRMTVVKTVESLTMEQLDYLHDPTANTIGALIMHLGAVDKYYQINTFEGREDFNDAEKRTWLDGMVLGDSGRKQIKGKEVKYYLDLIDEVRQKTLQEFKKKDDKWLLANDPKWSVNTYWKWFHVCEHESNHRGQMTWLKGRLPGARPGKD